MMGTAVPIDDIMISFISMADADVQEAGATALLLSINCGERDGVVAAGTRHHLHPHRGC